MITDELQKSRPLWKFAAVSPATTLAIWTPRSSARIKLTGLDIDTFGATTGTISVFFSSSLNTRGQQVAVYSVSTTTHIDPRFSGLDGGVDVPLNINSNVTSANVTAYGFEIE